jgi:hypothetical protein
VQVGPGGIVSHNHIYAMGLVDIKSPCQLRPTMSTKIVSLLGPSTPSQPAFLSHFQQASLQGIDLVWVSFLCFPKPTSGQ